MRPKRKPKPASNAKIIDLAFKEYKTPEEKRKLCRMVEGVFEELREGRRQNELRDSETRKDS